MNVAEKKAFAQLETVQPREQLLCCTVNDLPPMECGPKDCKMRRQRRAVATHETGAKLN